MRRSTPHEASESILPATLALMLVLAVPAVAQDSPSTASTSERAKPDRTWKLDFGFSYLATTGNSDTNSLGFNGHYDDKWGLWGLDASASAIQASEDGSTTAENYNAAVRGSRDLSERLALTTGIAGRKDRLAGIDLRTELDVALKWTWLKNEKWTSHLLIGPSWVREKPVDGEVDDYIGAIAQIDGEYQISDSASATARLTYLPDLGDSTDYRTEAEAGLQAAINRRLALKIGYLWLYDNQPVPGFEKSDTRTTASLVLKLGAEKKSE